MKTNMRSYFLGEPRELGDDLDEWFDPTKTAIIEIDMHKGHLGGRDAPVPWIAGYPRFQSTTGSTRPRGASARKSSTAA